MIVSLSIPYNARYRSESGTHLWFFYKQLADFSEHLDHVTFIGWEKNFVSPENTAPDSWEKSPEVQQQLEFTLPDAALFKRARIISVDQKMFAPLEEKFKSNNLVWHFLMTETYAPYMAFLRDTLQEIQKTEPVEAIVLCCNSPSAESVAAEMNIPVIHTEIGPLRKKQYLQTGYWDLSGVNGATEAKKRFLRSAEELQDSCLSRRQLLALFMEKEDLAFIDTLPEKIEFDIGVAGQVDDDSNIIAYANGFSNQELVKYASFHFGKDNVLFRSHPLAQSYFSSNLDLSEQPALFFKRIRALLTINSSMALEAALFGKQVMVLGDSPFALLSDDLVKNKNAGKEHLAELNFLCLNYIIPYAFLFDINYYRWRLSFPSEREIREKHLEYYCRKRGWKSIAEFKASVSVPEGRGGEDLNVPVLKVEAGNIPQMLVQNNELREWCELQDAAIAEFEKQCRQLQESIDFFQKETADFRRVAEYNEKTARALEEKLNHEVAHYQALLAEKKQEVEDYRKVAAYNEAEAKALEEKLSIEVAHYQALLAEKIQEVEDYRQVAAYNEAEAKTLGEKLNIEVAHYQALLSEKIQEVEDCRKVADYNEAEAKALGEKLHSEVTYYQALLAEKIREVEDYRKAAEYNESEAKALGEKLNIEVTHYQTLLAEKIREVEDYRKVAVYNEAEAKALGEKLNHEVAHYQTLLSEKIQEVEDYRKVAAYNEAEAKTLGEKLNHEVAYYQTLLAEKIQEVEDYRKVAAYNEAEAKTLGEKLNHEVAYYQTLLSEKIREVEDYRKAAAYNESEAKTLGEKLNHEVAYYQTLLSEKIQEVEDYRKVAAYNESEAKTLGEKLQSEVAHYQTLLAEKIQEVEDYRKVAEYNESEAKTLGEKLQSEVAYYQTLLAEKIQEVAHYQTLLAEKIQEVEDYRKAAAYNESEAKTLGEKLEHEIQYYQQLTSYHQGEIAHFKEAFEYNLAEAQRLAEVVNNKEAEAVCLQQALDEEKSNREMYEERFQLRLIRCAWSLECFFGRLKKKIFKEK